MAACWRLAVLVVCACRATTGSHEVVAVPSPEDVPTGAISVQAFGATGDGKTDDREAIQAAITAATTGHHDVFLPAGTFAISTAPRTHWGLDIPSGTRIHGAGEAKTVLLQAPNTGPSSRLIHISGDDVHIEDLTLDGNKDLQTRDEQRHGIFATNTDRLVVGHVTARGFTGDGFYLYTGAKHSVFFHVTATGNDRNGLTLGGDVDGTVLLASRFVGSKAQQVDSEPGGQARVTNTVITQCELDGGGVSDQYVLTVSGTNLRAGDGWTILANRLNGGVFVVWAEHVMIFGNTAINATTRPAVTVYRSSADVTILGNRFEQTQAQTPKKKQGLAGILVQGTAHQAPDRIHLIGNDVRMSSEQSFGIRVEGATSIDVIGNTLRGSGRPARGYAGIKLRATNVTDDFRRAVVSDNTIRNFGEHGITVAGNGPAKLLSVEITNNTFDDDSRVPSMTIGISLDDQSGAAQAISLFGNRVRGGVKTAVVNYPANATITGDPRN